MALEVIVEVPALPNPMAAPGGLKGEALAIGRRIDERVEEMVQVHGPEEDGIRGEGHPGATSLGVPDGHGRNARHPGEAALRPAAPEPGGAHRRSNLAEAVDDRRREV
jgi:hypothetical protein